MYIVKFLINKARAFTHFCIFAVNIDRRLGSTMEKSQILNRCESFNSQSWNFARSHDNVSYRLENKGPRSSFVNMDSLWFQHG